MIFHSLRTRLTDCTAVCRGLEAALCGCDDGRVESSRRVLDVRRILRRGGLAHRPPPALAEPSIREVEPPSYGRVSVVLRAWAL